MKGDAVRAIRVFNNWSRKELAEKLGYSYSLLAQIETNRKPVSDEFKAKLAKLVDIDDEIKRVIERTKKIKEIV